MTYNICINSDRPMLYKLTIKYSDHPTNISRLTRSCRCGDYGFIYMFRYIYIYMQSKCIHVTDVYKYILPITFPYLKIVITWKHVLHVWWHVTPVRSQQI